MSDKVSNLIITLLNRRKDSIIPFKVIPDTDGRYMPITFDRVKNFISVSFEKISLEIFHNAFGKIKETLEKIFVQDKIVVGDKWDLFT